MNMLDLKKQIDLIQDFETRLYYLFQWYDLQIEMDRLDRQIDKMFKYDEKYL